MLINSSCSIYHSWFNEVEKQEDRKFILFDPYLKTGLIKQGQQQPPRYCLQVRQSFRATHYWKLCFTEKKLANKCHQKIYRLQRNNRSKGASKELYRPGEVVQLSYIQNRKDYREKIIHPSRCLAFRAKNIHLLRSKPGNENWRINEDI
jgi:hypothetical protein